MSPSGLVCLCARGHFGEFKGHSPDCHLYRDPPRAETGGGDLEEAKRLLDSMFARRRASPLPPGMSNTEAISRLWLRQGLVEVRIGLREAVEFKGRRVTRHPGNEKVFQLLSVGRAWVEGATHSIDEAVEWLEVGKERE